MYVQLKKKKPCIGRTVGLNLGGGQDYNRLDDLLPFQSGKNKLRHNLLQKLALTDILCIFIIFIIFIIGGVGLSP
jgi:hypothetical protein